MSATGRAVSHAFEYPPGPNQPAPLQTLRVLRDPWLYLQEMRAAYGDTFTLRLVGSRPLVVVSEPTSMERLFTGDPSVLLAGTANRIVEPASGANAVLFLDHRSHLERRRLLLPAFHRPRLDAYRPLIATIAHTEIDSWRAEEPITLHPRFRRLAIKVMLSVMLGTSDTDTVTSGLEGDLLRIQFDASRYRARAALGEVVSRTRHSRPQGDEHVLKMLLANRDEHGRRLDDNTIVDELLALLVAGQETTAGSLAWAAERLSRHPAIQVRLRSAMQNSCDSNYVDAVIAEVLRVRPVLHWSVRWLSAPLQLSDWLIPEATMVAASIYLLHLRADLYPEPARFAPERFLTKHQRAPYAWVPFGGGVRRCLGASLALIEMKCVLLELLTRFELRPAREGDAGEDWRRSGITYVPADGATVRLIPRH